MNLDASTSIAPDTIAQAVTCRTDLRREAVRRQSGRNGLDHVEVGDEHAPVLYVYFLGKLPPELAVNRPGIERHLQLSGGDRIRGLRILDADPQPQSDPERDDMLVLTLDRTGDFSPYTLALVDVDGIDPRYASASFSFGICCPTGLDCKTSGACDEPEPDEPQINYLAKDYGSFRQLILDRLAVLMPDWRERHVPDIGITLVELLAYVGDQLSYYQDAVATEAYLGTARQRISVRRHARLVDYLLHEGCNARAWLHLHVSGHLELPIDRIAFITARNQPPSATQTVIAIEDLAKLPTGGYEFYEPLVGGAGDLQLREAHNEITVYTWGRRECCLPAGATSATLLDRWEADSGEGNEGGFGRALNIEAGCVLVFEETKGAKTGVAADADPRRRWAVRVERAELAEDALYPVSVGGGEIPETRATPLVEISWAAEDALPFALCLSAIGAAPECAYLGDITVVRGNIVLVDHGRTLDPEPLPLVPPAASTACCDCEGEPADVQITSGRYRPSLAQAPLVFNEPVPTSTTPASKCMTQDPRAATAALALSDDGGAAWRVRPDLLASGPDDRDAVVEIDNRGAAHLRFGDGEIGRRPEAGSAFHARYRIGGGSVGNVGAEAICLLVLKNLSVDGVTIGVRNPLPAAGGIDAEPIEEARLLAPGAFRQQIMRAVTAADYAALAQRNAALQRASARLAWTGSWYEADVAIDPLGSEHPERRLLGAITGELYRYRRMGHDLHVQAARYVPLKLVLEVCALPGYDRGHVKAALLVRFGNRRGPGGVRGFFHPDESSLGDSVPLSRIVAAAQSVAGVECVTVVEFHPLFRKPAREIDNGVLPLAPFEIAQLDNDPDHPERGQLRIDVRGGR